MKGALRKGISHLYYVNDILKLALPSIILDRMSKLRCGDTAKAKKGMYYDVNTIFVFELCAPHSYENASVCT
jgi:hypothetical protein